MVGSNVTLSGVVGRDPVRRATRTGEVIDFRLAVTDRVQDAAGVWSDGQTSWYQVNAWGLLGQNTAQSIRKGQRVVVHGALSVREYQAADGRKGREVQVRASAIGHDLTFGTSRFERAAPRQEPVAAAPPPSLASSSPDRSGEWAAPGTTPAVTSSPVGAIAASMGGTAVAVLDEPTDEDYDEPPF